MNWEFRGIMAREANHGRPQRFERLLRTWELASFLQPRHEVVVPVPEPAVMCMDKEPNHRLASLLREECPSALVIEAGTLTLALFTLDQATLPHWISFPYVVPEPGEEGEVTAAKWAR